MTHSGAIVQYGVPPTLQDIALSTSRMPRFAGHTRQWWTVLDHHLFVYAMMARDGMPPSVLLAGLLHDAHEALTGDVPTAMKPEELRRTQRQLDDTLIVPAHYGWQLMWDIATARVKEYDSRALHAEAVVIGPPALEKLLPGSYTTVMGVPGQPDPRDVHELKHLLAAGDLSQPSTIWMNEKAPNVARWLRLVGCLQAELRGHTSMCAEQ